MMIAIAASGNSASSMSIGSATVTTSYRQSGVVIYTRNTPKGPPACGPVS